jgi:hypothetical protein
MDFLEKLLGLLGMGSPEMGYDTIKEPGTTQPPLDREKQKKLMEEFGDTELLADIYNAQRTMEQPQVELGARYMDKYRSEVPGGLASLMFQPNTTAFGSAVPAGSPYNTSGGNYHQVMLRSLEDLEEGGYDPERRDRTIFHELGHIGEFITKDLIRAGVIPPSLANDYQMMGKFVGGLGDSDLAHSALHTMDTYYGPNQKYGKIPRTILEPEEKKKVSRTVKDIQAEINAEQKRLGKGDWSSKLTELVAQRDEAKASPTGSIEKSPEESIEKSPEEQILDVIFSKNVAAGMRAGFGRHYLDSPVYTKENNPDSTQEEIDAANERIKRINDYKSEKYGFDVTDFWENSDKMVDMMKRHTLTANKLAELIIENYPFGYIKEKVTDGY